MPIHDGERESEPASSQDQEADLGLKRARTALHAEHFISLRATRFHSIKASFHAVSNHPDARRQRYPSCHMPGTPEARLATMKRKPISNAAMRLRRLSRGVWMALKTSLAPGGCRHDSVEPSFRSSVMLKWAMDAVGKPRRACAPHGVRNRTQVDRLFDPNPPPGWIRTHAAFRAIGRAVKARCSPDCRHRRASPSVSGATSPWVMRTRRRRALAAPEVDGDCGQGHAVWQVVTRSATIRAAEASGATASR